MTIAVAGNFTEGVVLGAESAATYFEPHGLVGQVYEGAQKIYHLGLKPDCSDSPYGAMVYGAADYRGVSWRNVFANFCREPQPAHPEASGFADSFKQFLETYETDPAKRPRGGVFLSGFGPKDLEVHCFRITLPEAELTEHSVGSFLAEGIGNVAQRLRYGLDKNTENRLRQTFQGATIEVVQDGVKSRKPVAEVIIDTVKDGLVATCEPDINMPLRDAIDYVHFVVYTTVKVFKFSHLANLCGGEIELAAITLDRGFRRIRRKPLDAFIPFLGANGGRELGNV